MRSPNKNKQGVNPTKQHSMKCPKLYGKKCTCDGYHTFDELYEHRIILFITLCNLIHEKMGGGNGLPWKSTVHHDGSMYEGGWFIAGITLENGKQISYHIPISYWNKLRISDIKTAPEWDGHTPDDVLERLLKQ